MSQIPNELKDLDHWLVWKECKVNGKISKPSFTATGEFATIPDRNTWLSYESASNLLAHGFYDGLTFALLDTSYAIIDLDDCIVDGKVSKLAQRIVDYFGSYTEVSASGTGLHIIIKYAAYKPFETKVKFAKIGVEVICNWCGVSGSCVSNSLDIVECSDKLHEALKGFARLSEKEKIKARDNLYKGLNYSDTAVIEKMRRSKNSDFLVKLYEGKLPLTDDSRAEDIQDYMLAKNLLYWTNDNDAQVQRLMLSSALSRPAWNEEYLTRTINNAKKN